MRTFVTVSAGPSPQDALPVFSSDDPFVVEAAIRALIARAGGAALLAIAGRDSGDAPPTVAQLAARREVHHK